MPNLTNPWIGYTQRSYIQMKQAIIAKKNDPVNGIPELTDDNEGNDFIKMIGIWCGIGDIIQYYLDNRAREVFLPAAKRFESAVKVAREFDYRIKGVSPASGALRFYIDDPAPSQITIPVGTRVETEGGIVYLTTEEGIIDTGETQVSVGAKQWVEVSESVIGQSDGSVDQIFELNSNVADGSVTVTVGASDVFIGKTTFAFSKATDKHFVAGLNENRNMQVAFGDNITGVVPANGLDVKIGWFESQGDTGNVSSGKITELKSAVSVPVGVTLKVTNDSAFVGGAAVESLSDLKKKIPLSVRTQYRAVTEEDFRAVTELALGVAKAGVVFDCGKTVDVYIVPEGGGQASQVLLDDTGDYLDERKIITTFIRMFSAGQITVKQEWDVTAIPNYQNSVVENNVEAKILEFFETDKQDISGAVFIGDLYEQVEGATGVSHSKLKRISVVPHARRLDPDMPLLDWTRDLKDTAKKAIYSIIFIGSTQFNLLRDNVFLGTFSAGTLVDVVDLTFTVNGTYTSGDAYNFVTYPINKDVELDETSLPVTSSSDITITVTGGV